MTDMKNPPVDINQASQDDLIAIKGIGPGLAKSIIEGRPYQKLHDLVEVPGISETKLASLLPYLSMGKKKARKVSEPEPIKDPEPKMEQPVAKVGNTEAFVFLENRNERQDALLIIFGGFILGLIILFLRRGRE